MNNQRGGILSKLFVIPAGAALMVGFFFLGYYVGKYQSKSAAQSETAAPPLPEVASKDSRTQEEFTFYKTLTDKENKTVSIDLKPSAKGENKAENKQAAIESPTPATAQPTQKEKARELKPEKSESSALKETGDKLRASAKKETAPSNMKLRYTVQIASYPEKGMAENEVRGLKKRGYAAFVASSELPGKGMWHRVRLGSFSNKAAAERLQRELRTKENISAIVVLE